MPSNRNALFYLFVAVGVMALSNCAAVADEPTDEAAKAAQRPKIVKQGTIDIKLVETQPIVFNDKLYRLEAVRGNYPKNEHGKPYLRFVNVATGEFTPPFAEHHDLSCALVVDDTMYVAATPGWGASRIDLFWSKDLKHWETATAIELPGWKLFNTSMCRDDKRFVMAIEVGEPVEVVGQAFTNRFAVSNDMRKWEILPEPAVFTKEKYSACPAIRWIDGWYYMTYLEAIGDYRFNTFLVRSRDLAKWEASPLNPVIQFEDDIDKQIANEKFTDAEREEIAKALDRNNSDFDLCQWQGKVMISYSWGDQVGNEFLAQATYDGTLEEFFAGFFPKGESK
jgi:hypothetical protein